MKIMFEIDTANVADARLVAKFLMDAVNLAEQTKAPSVDNYAQDVRVPMRPPVSANNDDADMIPHELLFPKAPVAAEPLLEDLAAAYGLQRLPASEATSSLVAPSNVVQLHHGAGHQIQNLPPMPPAPPGPPAAPEYDANGMPWDARIHAGNKAKTITGAWKYRRGVDITDKAIIEASLPRGIPAVSVETNVQRVPILTGPNAGKFSEDVLPPMPSLPPTPPMPPAPPATVHSAVGSVVRPSMVAASVSLPLPPPPNFPPPPYEEPAIDFATLMIKVSEAMGANQLTHDQITAKIKPLGLDNLFTLSSRPDLVGHAAVALGF